MQFECPQCHMPVIAGEDERGKQVNCLACGAEVMVPAGEDEFTFTTAQDKPQLDSDTEPKPSAPPAPKPKRQRPPRGAQRLMVVRRVNPLAAASFILGVAGLVALGGWALVVLFAEPLAASGRTLLEMGFVAGASFVVWLAAVVTGFIAQGEIARSNGAQGGKLAAFLGGLLGLGCLVGMGMLVYTVLAASRYMA